MVTFAVGFWLHSVGSGVKGLKAPCFWLGLKQIPVER